ncbi:protein of unknown function [Methylocella tundrae]|uniref:HTH-like domain-containing protein n=1 Tax=Methylocella tundrae TaxID=227605 RepID=A0A4U8YX10_METTU|nr:protein of unknown function [Methylocella tundrae]
MSPTCPWTKPCFRTCWQKSTDAWPQAGACRQAAIGSESLDPARLCSALRVDRAPYAYNSKRGGQADIKQRIKEIAETRVRYGYRRIHVLLRREGWAANASGSIGFTRILACNCGTRPQRGG